MPTAVWKGSLTFGLVSIPVKLYRAARAEKVSFRQLYAGTGARVRQRLVADDTVPEPEPAPEPEPVQRGRKAAEETAALQLPRTAEAPAPKGVAAVPPPSLAPEPREISRHEIVKGYEYARDQYVTLTREELAQLAPQTAREMEILEFVRLEEIDPIYYETSYYVAPDRGGERAYSLLFAALRESGFAGLAQVAMHNREHIVVIRPGRQGILLHTMFYESEIRAGDEYRADTSGVQERELELALLLVRNLAAPFEPSKYRDTYREKLEALIAQKLAGRETEAAPPQKAAPVIDIVEALQRSLQAQAGRKPPAREGAPPAKPKRRTKG